MQQAKVVKRELQREDADLTRALLVVWCMGVSLATDAFCSAMWGLACSCKSIRSLAWTFVTRVAQPHQDDGAASSFKVDQQQLQGVTSLLRLRSMQAAVRWISACGPRLRHIQFIRSTESSIDLQQLSGLTALQTLDCRGYHIENMQHLQRLGQLQHLDFSGSPVGYMDCPAALQSLTQLRSLNIRGTHFRSLDCLCDLKSLTRLNVKDCVQIYTLDAVSNLVQLQQLECGGAYSPIPTLEPVRGLVQLRRLDCSGSRSVRTLEPLRQLTNLTELKCSKTGIHALEPLRSLQQLQFLESNDVDVGDLEPLSACTELQHLEVSHTRTGTLRPLSQLVQLRHLDISHTRVRSLEHVQEFTQLQTLKCACASIQYLCPLTRLSQLRALDCTGNPAICSLGPLLECTQLTELLCDDKVCVSCLDQTMPALDALQLMRSRAGGYSK
jgi:internalin A